VAENRIVAALVPFRKNLLQRHPSITCTKVNLKWSTKRILLLYPLVVARIDLHFVLLWPDHTTLNVPWDGSQVYPEQRPRCAVQELAMQEGPVAQVQTHSYAHQSRHTSALPRAANRTSMAAPCRVGRSLSPSDRDAVEVQPAIPQACATAFVSFWCSRTSIVPSPSFTMPRRRSEARSIGRTLTVLALSCSSIS